MKVNRRALTPIVIVAAGLAVAALLIATGPRVTPRPPEVVAPLVRVVEVNPREVQLSVFTHGTVAPRTESELIPEVSGRVTWVSPSLVSGGFISKDAVLLRIEPLDYEVALESSRARLARARSNLSDAKKDHKRQIDLQKRNVSSDAQLDDAANRLRVADAEMREATAGLSRAERDMERTEVRAPYDGRVRSERVDVGQFVNRGAAVGTIYAIDYAEVRLPVADKELAFLELPLMRDAEDETGPAVPVAVRLRARFAGKQHEWDATVVRTEGELDPRTRMVNVVARVEKPYQGNNGRPPLSVGLFVEAEIIGAVAEEVVVLPRSALRGDDQVLIVDGDLKLHFRDVDVLRVDRDEVFVRGGLARGEQICVSPLESVVDGMAVRTAPRPAVAAPTPPAKARS
jgi:RND family efflux transporter MFP subunit